MLSTASSVGTTVRPDERLEVLFDELAELVGQRNGIDGRIVEIVAELDRDELCGATGARSIAAVVAWKMGTSTTNATTIATVAGRLGEFPRCAQGMREGRLSLDQVGVIAARELPEAVRDGRDGARVGRGRAELPGHQRRHRPRTGDTAELVTIQLGHNLHHAPVDRVALTGQLRQLLEQHLNTLTRTHPRSERGCGRRHNTILAERYDIDNGRASPRSS